MKIDLQHIKTSLRANKSTLNILKSEFMIIGSRQRLFTFSAGVLNLNLFVDGISLRKVSITKCLGLEIDEHLTWRTHINKITRLVSRGLGVL